MKITATLILSGFILSSQGVLAVDKDEGSSPQTSPVRLSAGALSGFELEPADWPEERKNIRASHLYFGQELAVSVFESSPKEGGEMSSTNLTRNFPYDQFVLVLSGKAVLTDEEGEAQTFVQGDTFVIPKGFSGTWEEVGVFRELVVVIKEATTRQAEVIPVD